MDKHNERHSDVAIDWERYRNKRTLLVVELGEERAAELLYEMSNGNSAIASGLLGYDRNWAAHLWRRVLHKGGNGKSYSAGAGFEFKKYDNQKTLQDWHNAYLQHSENSTEHALTYEWKVPKDTETVILVPVSDLHFGSTAHDYPTLLRLIDWLKETPTARFFLAGDNFDVSTKTGPGRVFSDAFMPLTVAFDLLYEVLKPVVNQCIAVGTGNHEQRIEKALDIDFDPSYELAKRMGVSFIGYQAFLRYDIKIGSKTVQEYTHYHTHGCGAARTSGAKLMKAKEIAGNTLAELCSFAHLHQEFYGKYSKRVPDRDGNIINVEQHVMNLGAFLRYEGYSAVAGLAPCTPGVSSVELGVKKHSIHPRQ